MDNRGRSGLTTDVILIDYICPMGWTGLRSEQSCKKGFVVVSPVIILTGDSSAGALRAIANQCCVKLSKPVQAGKWTQRILELAASPPPRPSQCRNRHCLNPLP